MRITRRFACLQLLSWLGLSLAGARACLAQQLEPHAPAEAAEPAEPAEPGYARPNPELNPHWLGLRAELFGDQEPRLSEALRLQVPARAVDASAVPLSLYAPAHSPAESGAGLHKVYLIIDDNPNPLCAVFGFGSQLQAFVQTQVRINAYTHVRLVAVYQDDSRFMRLQYVKAVGGCSAPPLTTQESGPLGQIRASLAALVLPDGARQLQLSLQHPNHNGLQMDPMTRLVPPPDYLRHLRLESQGQSLFNADLDFAISPPPSFILHLGQLAGNQLLVLADDSQGRQFRQALSLDA